MKIRKDVIEAIQSEARDTAPHECCGFMMAETGDPAAVTWILPAPNIEREIPEQKFIPDHKKYLEAVELEAAGKAKIAGIYHSHPNGAPRPSAYDTEMAVPGLVYLIVAVGHETTEQLAWVLDNGSFSPESLQIE